jgi:hypothetical protein
MLMLLIRNKLLHTNNLKVTYYPPALPPGQYPHELPIQLKNHVIEVIPEHLSLSKENGEISELIYDYLKNQQSILLNKIQNDIINRFGANGCSEDHFCHCIKDSLYNIYDIIKYYFQCNNGLHPSLQIILDSVNNTNMIPPQPLY